MRICNHPNPANGGRDCEGDPIKAEFVLAFVGRMSLLCPKMQLSLTVLPWKENPHRELHQCSLLMDGSCIKFV